MASAMIFGSGQRLTVQARQKIKTAEAADKFNQDLLAKLQPFVDNGQTPQFDDVDIAQNPIPYDQFELFFSTLSTSGVLVERLRLFGCATMDDSAALLLADWLRLTTAENCPHELHISDCALTSDGFSAIMDAIAGNDAFPTPDRGGRRCPVYMRIENNYIEDEVIQEKIDSGLLVEYQKNGPIRGPVASNPEAKVKFICPIKGQFKQKKGVPPSPEDAPPPKPVYDRYTQQQEQAKGKGKGYGSWSAPQAWPAPVSWQQPQQQAWQAPQQQAWQQPQQQAWSQPAWAQQGAKPQVVQRQATPVPAKVVTASPQPAAFNAFNGTATVRSAADRSRTPVKPKQAPLPKPWEEQWSDEYQIPYYWNSETGESLWERPS